MPNELTPAERIVAEALAETNGRGHYGSPGPTAEDYADEARDVVAAVRAPLYCEAADRMLQHAQDAEDHDATADAVYTFMVAADRLREWSAAVGRAEGGGGGSDAE